MLPRNHQSIHLNEESLKDAALRIARGSMRNIRVKIVCLLRKDGSS